MRRFFIILIFSILLALLPVIAHALSYDQVSQIARDAVVLIDGCTSGSGVIYEHRGNVYSILTAKHVVSQRNGCVAITPDKIRNRINPSIITVSGIDLAVVQFTSNNTYKVAGLGNSAALAPGKTVYIAGAPEPSVAIPQRTVLITPGNIVGIQQPQNGYSLIYNNATRRGMSGGAVLNEEGKIVGIHGQGDEQDGSKVGLNLGIPIKLFLDSPKSISPPVTVKPKPKVSPYPVTKKPVPVTPKKIVVQESQPQSKPVKARKHPYESLTVEDINIKTRVKTCHDWLGNFSISDITESKAGTFHYIYLVLSIVIGIFSFRFVRESYYSYYCKNPMMVGFFGINSMSILLYIMFILFTFDYNFSSPFLVVIMFLLPFSGAFIIYRFMSSLKDSLLGTGIYLIIFYLYWMTVGYIGNTYCRPFGYSF